VDFSVRVQSYSSPNNEAYQREKITVLSENFKKFVDENEISEWFLEMSVENYWEKTFRKKL
jgi:hypothetical protein